MRDCARLVMVSSTDVDAGDVVAVFAVVSVGVDDVDREAVVGAVTAVVINTISLGMPGKYVGR